MDQFIWGRVGKTNDKKKHKTKIKTFLIETVPSRGDNLFDKSEFPICINSSIYITKKYTAYIDIHMYIDNMVVFGN